MTMAAEPIDWDAEAVKMAVYVKERMFPAHRGAMPWRQMGIAVAFGNDGYGVEGGPDIPGEVRLLRRVLEDEGIPILGFGVEPEDDYSWAMLVRSDDVRSLHRDVWRSWESAIGGTNYVQVRIADSVIAEDGIRPDSSPN
jgi:hypothetical protein